jgi:hypothetical protein
MSLRTLAALCAVDPLSVPHRRKPVPAPPPRRVIVVKLRASYDLVNLSELRALERAEHLFEGGRR